MFYFFLKIVSGHILIGFPSGSTAVLDKRMILEAVASVKSVAQSSGLFKMKMEKKDKGLLCVQAAISTERCI